MNDVISNSNRWVYYNQWIARFRDNYNNNESSQKKKVVYRKRMYVNQIQWKGLGAEGGGLILIKKKRGRDMEVIHMIDKVT